MTKRLILILGGARSGKSRYAESLARSFGGCVMVVATAVPGDVEMQRRIEIHRQQRPRNWRVLEEPRRLGMAIERSADNADIILVDCITLWLTNLLLSNERVSRMGDVEVSNEVEEELTQEALFEVVALVSAYKRGSATMIVVTNEVGLGLVPPYPSSRVYRDLLGRVNQELAAAADEVYLLVAGLPIELKGLAHLWPFKDLPDD